MTTGYKDTPKQVFSMRFYRKVKESMMAEPEEYCNGKVYKEEEEDGTDSEPKSVRGVQKVMYTATDFYKDRF